MKSVREEDIWEHPVLPEVKSGIKIIHLHVLKSVQREGAVFILFQDTQYSWHYGFL